MKTAKELYPECEGNDNNNYLSYSPSSYNRILNEFGEILIQVDDDSYQGDSRLLYEKDGKLGYLQFGWGSCSGCDALQACNTYEDIDELIKDLNNSIRWFDNEQACLYFFENHDWKLDYSYSKKEQKEFIDNVIKYLKSKL